MGRGRWGDGGSTRRPAPREPSAGRFGKRRVLPLLCALAVASPAPARSLPAAGSAVDPFRRVVLLHGLGRSARDLALLEHRLERLGYAVCNVDYDSRAASIEAVTAVVSSAIEACGFERGPLHFVTHSMGSLVLRALARDGRLPQGGRAVLLAPPSSGSELADRLGGSRWFGVLLGPLAPRLGTGGEDLPARLPPPSIPFGVVAGDRAWNPLGWLWLPGPHDGTVAVARTRLPGMSDHIVLPYTHTFIAWAPAVARQVDVFLRTGRFERAGARADLVDGLR